MITDIEVSAMEGLKWLCKDKIARDILEGMQEMLCAMDSDVYYSASDEKRTEFLQEYADEINDVIKDAVQNDGVPKKKIGDWEVVASFGYGDKEIFIGENLTPEKETERFILGDIVREGMLVRYENVVGSDSYNEIAELYSQRMQEQIQKVKEKNAKFPYDRTVIREEACDSIRGMDIKGEIVVLKPESIKPEYVGADTQLCVAESGFGCSPEGSGRAVYCKNIFTGESAKWDRGDILGVLKPECVPEWVRERMTDKPIEVLFTFGSSEKFPFQMGYVSITAPSVKEAIAEFRRNWPDRTEGILNCADYYYTEESKARILEHGNGAGCHRSLDITIPPMQKSIDSVLENAAARCETAERGGKEREIGLD